jgi:hypothetical protein
VHGRWRQSCGGGVGGRQGALGRGRDSVGHVDRPAQGSGREPRQRRTRREAEVPRDSGCPGARHRRSPQDRKWRGRSKVHRCRTCGVCHWCGSKHADSQSHHDASRKRQSGTANTCLHSPTSLKDP